MRPLLIDEKVLAAVMTVREHAEAPENLYVPGQSPQPPGDDARHVVLIPVGFRCVFSITRRLADAGLYRHLTISVEAGDRYPNEAAAFMLASMFGFTGWDERALRVPGADWKFGVNHDEHCVVVIQDLP
jgi:hypothetical protein